MTFFWNMNALHRVWLMFAIVPFWWSLERFIP